MTKEHAPEQPYWNFDEALCEATFFDERFTVRMQGHRSEEAYHSYGRSEIVPVTSRNTSRAYVQVRPYILVPDMQLEIGLFPTRRGQHIGEVTRAEWTGMRHERIGDGQAWYYPADHTLILWELTLLDRYREAEHPLANTNLAAVWQGFETFLLGQFPKTRTLATPSWEPLYEPQEWQQFLGHLGYQARNPQAFAKDVG